MTNILTRLADNILTTMVDKIKVTPPGKDKTSTTGKPTTTNTIELPIEGELDVCKVTDKLIVVKQEENDAISWNDQQQPGIAGIPGPPTKAAIETIGKINGINITYEKYIKYRQDFHRGRSITQISNKHQRVSKGNSKSIVAAYSKAFHQLEQKIDTVN